MLSELLIIVSVWFLCLWYNQYSSRPPNFPKGPSSFPLVGSLPFLGKDAVKTFQAWKVKYGPIVGFNFSTYRTVVINDYNWIKEAYDQESFSGRPSLPPLLLISGGQKKGLILSEGQTWVEQRRFSLRHLRDFGFGKRSMEGMIHEDIQSVLAKLKSSGGQPIETGDLFSVAVFSSLWRIIAGEREADSAEDDAKFKHVLDTLRKFIQSIQFGSPTILFYLCLDTILPKCLSWINPFALIFDPIKAMLRSYIVQHKRTYENDDMRDFIDVYLQEIKGTKDTRSSFYGVKGEENLLIAILNLFAAGSEGTSNTINWAVLLLSLHPDKLKKVQEELEKVVGSDRLPSLEDRESCIYIQAVIQEVFRFSSITPIGVFHNTMRAVQFHGYTLPKDTMVIANLYGIHFDKELWGDPEDFRPERFLSADGRELLKHKRVVSFSMGKRMCLGEMLARNEFFLFFTAICQKFDFEPNPHKPKPDPFNVIPSFVRSPREFEVCFYDRYQ